MAVIIPLAGNNNFLVRVKPNTFTVAETGAVVPVPDPVATLVKLPVQLQGMVEANVQVRPCEQADKVPTFHVSVFPAKEWPVPPPPTQDGTPAHAGKASVTVMVSFGMVEIVRLRNAVSPLLAWKPKLPVA